MDREQRLRQEQRLRREQRLRQQQRSRRNRRLKRKPKMRRKAQQRRRYRVNPLVLLIAAVLLVGGLVFAGIRLFGPGRAEESAEKDVTADGSETGAERGEPVVSTASVIAVGDNLYHRNVILSGYQQDTGGWDYRAMYEHVKDAVQNADLAIADQETVLTSNHNITSGYPRFYTPVEAADALADIGFDVVYSSTNHADDQGEQALLDTVRYWKENHPEITLVGIHDSPEDADTIKVREVNGIKVAFLNYTYGTNSLGFTGDKAYLMDVFSDGSEKIAGMIRRAKEQADCVVFIAHWGLEDEPMPTEYEKQWATFLMQQGVDVCIGGHPHNLQPYGYLSDEAGHRMLLFYSLGNFVSNMDHMLELLEGMGSFTIVKKTYPDGSTEVEIKDADIRPMVMHFDYARTFFRVYFLEDYTEELAAGHWLRMKTSSFTPANLARKFEEIMSINVKPSKGTSMLNVRQTWDGTLYDPEGKVVERPKSVTEYEYYAGIGVNIQNINIEQDYTAGYTDR